MEKNSIQRYAVNNGLEVIFSEGHRYYDRIFYDSVEGKYYDRYTDFFLQDAELAKFGLGAK